MVKFKDVSARTPVNDDSITGSRTPENSRLIHGLSVDVSQVAFLLICGLIVFTLVIMSSLNDLPTENTLFAAGLAFITTKVKKRTLSLERYAPMVKSVFGKMRLEKY